MNNGEKKQKPVGKTQQVRTRGTQQHPGAKPQDKGLLADLGEAVGAEIGRQVDGNRGEQWGRNLGRAFGESLEK